MLRIWLDDTRKAPRGWLWVKSYSVCKLLIVVFRDCITDISFDHDLGTEKDGNDIALLIERMAYEKKLKPLRWEVHSANPVGGREIEATMRSAERFWK
jgi:hypothetical protein